MENLKTCQRIRNKCFLYQTNIKTRIRNQKMIVYTGKKDVSLAPHHDFSPVTRPLKLTYHQSALKIPLHL